jgi:hypothetical protein
MRSTLPLLFAAILVASSTVYAEQSLLHNNGDVVMDVTDFGAFVNFSQNQINPTFRYPASDPNAKYYLQPISELWAGNSEKFVASSVDLNPETGGLVLGEWRTTETGAVSYVKDEGGRQTITAQYRASDGERIDILIDQTSYSWTEAKGCVVFKLTITNLNPLGIKNLLLGILANWDVDDQRISGQQVNLNLDMVKWDPALSLFYFYDADESDGIDPTHVGLCLIEGELNGHKIAPYTGNLYLDPNRFRLMSEKTLDESVIPGNYVSLISIGPYNLETRSPKTVIFAFVAGGSLDDLRANAEMARRMVFVPDAVKAEMIEGYIELSWRPPIDPEVSGYRVYRKAEGETDFRMISDGTISAARFKDYDVQEGRSYTYIIRPVTLQGELDYASDEVTVKVIPKPLPPSQLQAELRHDGVKLSWKGSTTAGISGYVIFRNRTGREPWTPIASVESGKLSFLDDDVFPENGYFYAVAAVGEGEVMSDLSEPVEVYVPPTSSPPKPSVNGVLVAPNPCSISKNGSIKFLNLPAKAVIRVYTPSGGIVREIVHRDRTSQETWDLKGSEGDGITPGVYIYRVEMYSERGETSSITGKLAISP